MPAIVISWKSPGEIILTAILILFIELYIWRTVQPQEEGLTRELKIHWPKPSTIKKLGLLWFHILASITIPLALNANHVFIAYDEESAAVLIFFLYWGVFVVIPWGFRRNRTKFNMEPLQEAKGKDTSADIQGESRQPDDSRPNILSLIDKPKYKRFGKELKKIKNVKITTRLKTKESDKSHNKKR